MEQEIVLGWKKRIGSLGTGFYILIPADWLRQNNLVKGKGVDMSLLSDGSLRITPENSQEDQE